MTKVQSVKKPIVKINTHEKKLEFTLYYGRKICKKSKEEANLIEAIKMQALRWSQDNVEIDVYINGKKIVSENP